MKTELEKLKEHLQIDVELSFLTQKDADRISWYIDKYFLENEKKQIKEAFNEGYRQAEIDDRTHNAKDISEYDDAEIYFNNTYLN